MRIAVKRKARAKRVRNAQPARSQHVLGYKRRVFKLSEFTHIPQHSLSSRLDQTTSRMSVEAQIANYKTRLHHHSCVNRHRHRMDVSDCTNRTSSGTVSLVSPGQERLEKPGFNIMYYRGRQSWRGGRVSQRKCNYRSAFDAKLLP